MNHDGFKRAYPQARDFMLKNARLLDRQMFFYLFEDGDRELALAALQAYQNPDGGFGNALESDLRGPGSQPLAVDRAFVYLDRLGAFDHSMVTRVLDYLETITTPEGGIPYALPSLNDYPHSPWMHAEENPPASLNPTAGLVGLLLKHGVQHPWILRAAAYCWKAIAASEETFFHEVMPVVEFLQHVPDTAMAELELTRILDRIRHSPDAVALDPAAAGYVKFPLDWAPHPSSYFRRLFDNELIERHLAALAAKQQADGGWPINFPALSPAAEQEWRGVWTTEAMWTLWEYGY